MCGICGIVDFKQLQDKDRTLLDQMVASLHHRGPDDRGTHLDGPVGLGHTRLSILDLSQQGHQPMFSDDRAICMVYNGEVYNFQALAAELTQAGMTFNSRSDSEVLLKAYQHWGTAAFSRFQGMFAAAFWDSRDQTLHLIRDRFGIKPLFYLEVEGGSLVFGSEIKALLASQRLEPQLHWSALHEYLHYGVPLGGHSFFRGVQQLRPGHALSFSAQGAKVWEYASIYSLEPCQDDHASAVTTIRDLLERAVKGHLVSDVPVGVFLSGGIDSSAITAFASRHYGGRLDTFSVGFDFEKGVNELPLARRVAEHFGTQHHELHVEGKRLPQVIEQLVAAHDQPFGDVANIPLFLLCQALEGQIKVVLQGDGGDEIFGGYPRYARLNHIHVLRTVARLAFLAKPLLPRRSIFYRGLRTFYAFKQPDPSATMALLMSQEFFDYPPTQVFSADAQAQLFQTDPFSRYRHFYHQFADLDPVQRMLYTDCGIILADKYFEKVDRATMQHSIEVRVPMVDQRLAAYVMSLPAAMKVVGKEKKFLLRQALRGIVPDYILDAPKTGFSVPIGYWLRGPLKDFAAASIFDQRCAALFDRKALERCFQEHVSGTRNNAFLLNKILNLCLWYVKYLHRP